MGRFHALVPIRCRGAIHFYSARTVAENARNVVVMAPRLPREEARARLATFARAHRLAAGGAVPDVASEDLDAEIPWIALDCDAVADQETLGDFVRHGGDKPEFYRVSAVGKTVMETLVRTHGMEDPVTRRPLVLGSLAASNLLFSAQGKLWLVGFGAGPLSGACVAPEVAAGGAPTPGADVFALTMFLRSQMDMVLMPPVMRRVLQGSHVASDAKLVVLFVWSNLKILAGPARARPTMAEALSQAQTMWRLVGVEPDVAALAAWVAHALAENAAPLENAPRAYAPQRIVVGRDAEWLETPNQTRHMLHARRPLRRVLLALTSARRDRPGAVVAVSELVEAGWPGESPMPEAANNRVYVAISTLRKLGLGEHLQRWDGGYRIDPNVHCHFE